jgi:aminoglycoside phosphotransferase (APT) family kinase protein
MTEPSDTAPGTTDPSDDPADHPTDDVTGDVARDPTREAASALLADNQLDRAWLNRVLNEAGIDGRIEAMAAETIGTGQVGDNVRCHLRWDRDPAPAGPPATVILKLPSADETSRNTGGATRAYLREVGFYRDAAPTVDIRVPAVHHLWEDRPGNRFVLVMEDIAPAETGNQLTGCTLERAELAVDAAASLHGSSWGRSDELAALDWVDRPSPERAAERTALFQALFGGFVDRYRDVLRPEDLDFGHWLADHYDRWQHGRLVAQCLVHGDFRLDNLLFGLGPPAPPITAVDWQTVSLGAALDDVAYFLSGSLPPDELARTEPGLLTRYRDGLAERGVELTTDEVQRDYRSGAPAGYVMAVIASQIVGQTERGDRMFVVMASGSAALARRLDTPATVG